VFWEEAQQFRKLDNEGNREEFIQHLFNKYLSDDAIIELNLPSKKVWVDPVMQAAQEYKQNAKKIPRTILDKLVDHCRGDMMDFFYRFKSTAAWERINYLRERFDETNGR
jgi:hypothetical protein